MIIKFLLTGLLRDRNRSFFPVLIVAGGVMLTTIMYSWMNGVVNDVIDNAAKFEAGHLKVVTNGYNKLSSQIPNDLGLIEVNKLRENLEKKYPQYYWSPRIKFGGLLDIPDQNGETKTQATVAGIAFDFFSNDIETKKLNIREAIRSGRLPEKPGEILISDEFAKKLKIKNGETATILTASANGGLAFPNFVIVGTIHFGMIALDRGAVIADISDLQYSLDMHNGCGELIAYRKNGFFNAEETRKIKDEFNQKFNDPEDEYSPVMLSLEDQNGLGEYLQYAKFAGLIIVSIFMLGMFIILWNTGLMSGIRRYGEMGVRLALGESKSHIYKTLLYESGLIAILGSLTGTIAGLLIAYYLQVYGIDVSTSVKDTSLMIGNVMKARINFTSYYIGFIPGFAATLFGAAISGIAIFRRQTASLFKELEA
ncbi:MAG: ABC transporter permease [Rhodothermaceae bacterium]